MVSSWKGDFLLDFWSTTVDMPGDKQRTHIMETFYYLLFDPIDFDREVCFEHDLNVCIAVQYSSLANSNTN